MSVNRGPVSPRKAAILAEQEEQISFEWIVMKLIDESHAIRAALDEYRESGSDDWSVPLTLWSLQFEGFQLVADGAPDPSVRQRFEAALKERQRVMNAALERVRKGQIARQVWPVLKEKGRVNGH